MPQTPVVYFKLEEGRVHALDAIDAWTRRDERIGAKCMDRIALLREHGHPHVPE